MTNSLNKISEEEILESLSRSGYLLESEITKRLVDYGFFVESNITTLDPLTGKNREIDLLAEYHHEYDPKRSGNKTVAFARFVFEIKNNNAPLVLMTKYEFSPNSEIYNGLKVAATIPQNLENIFYSDFYHELFNKESKNLYTQYCSFSKKKNEELMAHHPENIYSALTKITYFCEKTVGHWNNEEREYKDDYLRNFLYLPVVLINEDLYELELTEDNKNKLRQVECSHLVFNYHYDEEPQTSIVYFVTKKGLEDFLKEILRAEKAVEENLLTAKMELLQKQNAK